MNLSLAKRAFLLQLLSVGRQRWLALLTVVCCWSLGAMKGQNPIVPNVGLNDPHVRIFGDTAYLYASHDADPNSNRFRMDDWWIWSSPDLVNWTHRSTLRPKDTYLSPDFQQCWATDIGERDGQFYYYFSEGNQRTGVVQGPSPVGPWRDILGKPLLDSTLTPTDEYDPSIYSEGEERYLVFGVWDYYIARLGEDMMSLAETPRPLDIKNPQGPYGKGKTDDKVFLHRRGDTYYLSWGAFYATSANLYGPYTYRGTVLDSTSFAAGYDAPTWPHGFLQGRHGSFFSWHGQDYFSYCDMSQTGNRRFRDAFISYVHYRADGSIAPLRVDGLGVGRHVASAGLIPAEEFHWSKGFAKQEQGTGFAMQLVGQQGTLGFQQVEGLPLSGGQLTLKLGSETACTATARLRLGSRTGPVLAEAELALAGGGAHDFTIWRSDLPALPGTADLYWEFTANRPGVLLVDGFEVRLLPQASPTGNDPGLLFLDEEYLARTKASIGDEGAALLPALTTLRKRAEELLALKPPSVIDNDSIPPGGDAHDYYSIGPYWWPDTTQPNGLPWIRRDGVRNPATRAYDSPLSSRMRAAVETLTLASYYTNDTRYSDKAVTLVRTWFLDTATYMRPHLEFGQAIPGRVDGRPIGIIETTGYAELLDFLTLLRWQGALSDADELGLRQWFATYLAWLQDSPKGRQEGMKLNNHGTAYDVQVAAFARWVGHEILAREVLTTVGPNRIGIQVEADGKQPHELVRTKAMSYTLHNTLLQVRLAELCQGIGLDLWSYRNPRGSGIVDAIGYPLQFYTGDDPFPYQQLGGIEQYRGLMHRLLVRAANVSGAPSLTQALVEIDYRPSPEAIDVLLRPLPARASSAPTHE